MSPNISEQFVPPENTNTLADEYFDPRVFCRLRFSPMLATGVIVDIIREHFGNPHSIKDPSLQRYVWRNDNNTAVLIEPSSNKNLANVGQRPAVLVRRNAIKNNRIILNDETQPLGPVIGREFVTLFNGSHTVFCVAAEAGHTEALANEVGTLLLEFSPMITESLCFSQSFRLEEIGQLGILEGSGGQYVVPLTFSYVTSYSWTLDEGLPPIRHVNFKLLFNY